ncbi:MAG: CAP domain-containing protein [Roseiflexaceae bacterium]
MKKVATQFITLIALLLLSSAALGQAQEGPGTQVTENYVYLPHITNPELSTEQQILALVNAERAAAGCPALTLNSKLTQAAYLHAQDMLQNDFFSHTGSNGSSVGTRVTAQGYPWRRVAENIAAGYNSPESVMEGWMTSDGHRANILNCNYTQLGVGYIYDANDGGSVDYNHYWVQVFATPR